LEAAEITLTVSAVAVADDAVESEVALVGSLTEGTATTTTVTVNGAVDATSYVYCAVEVTGTPVTPVVAPVRMLNTDAFDDSWTVGRALVEVEAGEVLDDGTVEEVSSTFSLTLDVTDDDTVYVVVCVATSLNPDFELARYRSAAATIDVTSLEEPAPLGDSSLVYVVCTTLFMLVAAFFY